jgi:hypothetical protein
MTVAAAGITANWSAVAVCLVICAPAVGAIVRAFRAPSALQREFAEDRRRTRAEIEGNFLIPKMGELLIDLTAKDDKRRPREDRLRNLQNNLQATDYLPAIQDLGSLARDHSELQTLQDDACKWSRGEGISAGAFLLGFLYPACLWSLDGYSPPAWLGPPAYLLLGLGGAFAVAFFVQETSSRNRLSEIVRKYE